MPRRIGEAEIDERIREALAEKPAPSPTFGAQLFAQAASLLEERRARHASRLARAQMPRFAWLRNAWERAADVLVIRPQLPAAVATAAAFVVAVYSLLPARPSAQPLSYESLPPLPRNNEAPALYDLQRLAEERAYEREVEDAHRKTSGGI